MKYAASAAVLLAAGVGLAAVAQAQGTYSQGSPNTPAMSSPSATSTNMPNGGSSAMPGTATETNQQVAAPARMQDRLATRSRVSRSEVRQAQEQLKSDGLYRGPVDGIMGHQTRASIARFQQRNGLHRTARLDRNTLAQLTGGKTDRVGSSSQTDGMGWSSRTSGMGSSSPTVLRGSPANQNSMTPPASPAPNGAGGGSGNTTGNH